MTDEKFEDKARAWKEYTSDLSKRISFDTFDSVVQKTLDLLEFLSDSACRSPVLVLKKDITYILTGDFLLSTSQTLKSIAACCKLGNFSDANALTRKYRDDLFLYLYILQANENAPGLTDEEITHMIGDEMTPEAFVEIVALEMDLLSQGVRKDKNHRAIDAWFDNSANDGTYRKILDMKNYLKYLKTNPVVDDCIKKHGLDDLSDRLARKQNNYVHNNGRTFLSENMLQPYDVKKSANLLENVANDISMITSFFLTVLILVRGDYIASTTYVDCMEMGLTPPDGCQYWVAPIVQEYIDEFFDTLHPELKKYLRDTNPYGMLIDA